MSAATDRARAMRKTLTPQEARLWLRLKALRAQGYHVRRQAPFRGYVLDFVCFSRRLAVEVDGGQHAEDRHAAHDRVRDAVLAREGFRTLRFTNGEVNTDVDGVMDHILQALTLPPPRGEGQAARPSGWGERLDLPTPHPGRFAACPSPPGGREEDS